MNCVVCNVREWIFDFFFCWDWELLMLFYCFVVFYFDGDYVIFGSLRDVFILNGDV